MFPGGAVSSNVVRLRVARCVARCHCWRLRPRRNSGLLSMAAMRHQRLQNGPRARLAACTRRPVVHHPRRLVDAVPWTVRAVGAGPVIAPAAVARQGPGAVERASNVDQVPRRAVQRHLRRSASVTGTLARCPVTLLR